MARFHRSTALHDHWLDYLADLAAANGDGRRHRRRSRSLRQQWVDWLLASSAARQQSGTVNTVNSER